MSKVYYKDFRQRLGLTQKEVAKIIQTTPALIAKYESGKTVPVSNILLKYAEHLNANPNFLLLGIEPHLLAEEDSLIAPLQVEYLRDLVFITTSAELKHEFKTLLVKKSIEKLGLEDKEKEIAFQKLLEAIKSEGNITIRPALFMFNLFKYLVLNKDELEQQKSYKNYLIELVKRYKIETSFNSVFIERVKKQITDNILLNISEDECNIILENPKKNLEVLESKLSSTMLLAYKFKDVNSIFQQGV